MDPDDPFFDPDEDEDEEYEDWFDPYPMIVYASSQPRKGGKYLRMNQCHISTRKIQTGTSFQNPGQTFRM